ncbi:MAG TPA: hypothetical protein VHV28_16340 [Solirubrobacteraceae bacterium]|jgi:hypothetical protein|nr:hypothetical protein [Solirubrobacteraceae bacterium]
MRGGSVPLLVQALVLSVMLAMNWIWTSDTIQVATFGFAALTLTLGAGLLAWRSRGESVRRGPPRPDPRAQAAPAASLAAVLIAVAVAMMVFGLAFGRFPVYFGAGLFIAGLGRLAIELRAQRRSITQLEERR